MSEEPASTGTPAPEQNPGTPEPAPGQSKTGDQASLDQKSFDQGYGKGMEKARAAEEHSKSLEAKLTEANARLATLENQGKSADELQEIVKAKDDELAARTSRLEALQDNIKSSLQPRIDALPDKLKASLEKAAGDDLDKQLALLPEFESIASDMSKKSPPQGGTQVSENLNIDLAAYDKAMNDGDAHAMLAFEKKHGKDNVLAAMRQRHSTQRP